MILIVVKNVTENLGGLRVQVDNCSIEADLTIMCRIFAVVLDTQLCFSCIPTNRRTNEAKNLPPFSTTPKWKAFEGFLQRLAFAMTMGTGVLVMFIMLWVLSVPWVAWCLLRVVHPAVSFISQRVYDQCTYLEDISAARNLVAAPAELGQVHYEPYPPSHYVCH